MFLLLFTPGHKIKYEKHWGVGVGLEVLEVLGVRQYWEVLEVLGCWGCGSIGRGGIERIGFIGGFGFIGRGSIDLCIAQAMRNQNLNSPTLV